MASDHPQPPAGDGGSVISFEERRRARDAAAPGAVPAQAPAAEETTRARVAAVNDTCWCCRGKVRAIVGLIIEPRHTKDGTGFLPLEQIDEILVAAVDAKMLARRGIGELRHRDSPGVEGGYIANGCPDCDALIGRFHLEDLLTEHRNAGGSLGQLDIGIAFELDLRPLARRSGLTALG